MPMKVRAASKEEAERVEKYMIRSVLSLQRLSFDETEGRVLYHYDKGKLEPERMDYLEFIARVTSHIPDKGQMMVRYYGLYSNVALPLFFGNLSCHFEYQDISGWKSRKIVRDLWRAQKANSYFL